MIARDSKSYPYLAIAQHYNVSYAEVLKYADSIDNINEETIVKERWQQAVFNLWLDK